MIIQIKQDFSGKEEYDSRVLHANMYPDINMCYFRCCVSH